MAKGKKVDEEKPSIVNDIKTRIKIEEQYPDHVNSSDYPGTYAGSIEDDAWDFAKFKDQFSIDIKSYSPDRNELEFDMCGVDPSLANAFRRILLAEVPSMAIEKVHILNNTSVIQDEVLAHRLGLIPLAADHSHFKMPAPYDPEEAAELAEYTEEESLEYELKIRCSMPKDYNKDTSKSKDINDAKEDRASFVDSKVYSGHIKWTPIGAQAEKFKPQDVLPIHDKILINKLNPGQELDLKLIAVKGIGKDHAKFSPVATAFYRLLTQIELKDTFYDEEAEKLAKCFTPGVIEIHEVVDDKTKTMRRKAVVANARADLTSRQVFMHEDLKDRVDMFKLRNHFIFSVESTGAVPSGKLMLNAIDILESKAQTLLNEINRNKV